MSHPYSLPKADELPIWKRLGYDSALDRAEDEINKQGPEAFTRAFGEDGFDLLCELLCEWLPEEQYKPIKESMVHGPADVVHLFGDDALIYFLRYTLQPEEYAPVKELMIQRLEAFYADGK